MIGEDKIMKQFAKPVEYENVTKSWEYRGMLITKNLRKEFGSCYYTIMNIQDKNKHIHMKNVTEIKRIIDCCYELKEFGTSYNNRFIRRNASRLMGTYIQ
jgi:hypothetical protein